LIAGTMKSQRGNGGGGIGPEETLIAAPLTKGSATGDGVNQPGRRQEDDVNLVAYALRKDPGGVGQGHNTNYVAGPLGGGNDGIGRRSEEDLVTHAGVRRLTPTECERLQALPDGWTQLGDTPDSRRYSALGDAVTATVAEWIGRRLMEAECG
jgi:site-specific DNA-cytosine methylase